ncbi:MAG: PH domain-containing protein [Clostridia bacterium]|nr:PH domain-containing protein [Clostridia bacterium]
MGNYVEKNLYENELIVEKARRDKWGLIGTWIFGILFCWLLLIPLIIAIKETVVFTRTELVLTNKRIVRKSGVFHTKAFDAPLSKILNVYVETTFWGKVFNTNKIRITTALGVIVDRIQNADDFKSTILGQIDQFEEARLARQAAWTAQAMASHTNAQSKTVSEPAKKKRVGRYD